MDEGNLDFIDYEIINGVCSYCGRDADYSEDSLGKGRFYCAACDSYNDSLELEEDDTLLIVPAGDNNLNVYF